MISLKECNEQIKALQLYLQNNKGITDAERIAVYDTLTFYLDSRALLIMRDCSNNDNEGGNNDLVN
jgi:hypothetical protein